MAARSRLLPLLALALGLFVAPLSLTGCDTTSTDGPVFVDTGVRSTTFVPRRQDFAVNTTGDVATLERASSQLTRSVVDDGLVLLYARGDLLIEGAQDTWVALPYTQGIEGVGPNNVPFVDFTISYVYSFGVNRLFVDVISSARILDTQEGARYIPDGIPFRLVTIPGSVARATAVDFSDYEAVRRTFGLEE